MGIEKTQQLLEENLQQGNLKGFAENLDNLFHSVSEEKVCKILSVIFFQYYTRYKADYLAKFLEISIRKSPGMALLNHPENDLFKLTILRGSKDLYDCYIEEGVAPFLSNVLEEEHELHYMELQGIAESISESLFPKYVECLKGMDYNGAFGKYEKNEKVVLINSEDYETLEDVAAKYNTIIGRRDIINDLSKRAGLE